MNATNQSFSLVISVEHWWANYSYKWTKWKVNQKVKNTKLMKYAL
jgi:hypothetical protein